MTPSIQNLSPTQAVHLLNGYQIDLKDLMRVTITELLAKKIIKIYPDKTSKVLLVEADENYEQITSREYFFFFRYKKLFRREVYAHGKRLFKREAYPFQTYFWSIYHKLNGRHTYRKSIVESLREKGFYPSGFWGKLWNGDDLNEKGWRVRKELKALKQQVEEKVTGNSLSKKEKAKWLTLLGVHAVILAPSVLTNLQQETAQWYAQQASLHPQDELLTHLEFSLEAIANGLDVAEMTVEVAGAALEGVGATAEVIGSAAEGVGGLLEGLAGLFG